MAIDPGPPQISDRSITTLAILKVNHDQERTFLGSYLPYVYHCLAETPAEVVSTPDLQSALEREFDIQLPQAVLKRLLSRACDAETVALENGIYKINKSRLRGCTLNPTRDAFRRGYRQLLDGLIAFAREQFELDWSLGSADQTVSNYIDGFSSGVLAAALRGQAPPAAPSSGSPDEYVVHRFVVDIAERNQQLFGFMETVVKGRMLADALFFEPEENPDADRSLGSLEVYLDGPLLLHILGYAGAEIQAPCRELLEMLKHQGASLRCFAHSLTEAEEILDAAAERAWSGRTTERFYGDVVAYLVRAGKTPSDIRLMAERLQRDLLTIGIQTVDSPPHNPEFAPDELALERMLQKEIGYHSSLARTRDIDSLTAINRLRKGRVFRRLARSRAVFVTNNYDLFRVSARFFERHRRGRVVPHCVFSTAFTVLIWLQETTRTPDLPRERIIADAYAALNPPDSLWERYSDEIDRLRANGSLSDDDVYCLRYADEARISLMDLTRGDSDVFTEGTLHEVLERAHESAQTELRAQLDAERAARRRALTDIAKSNERVTSIAQTVALYLSSAIFAVLAVVLALGVIFGPIGPVKQVIVPAAVQIPCAVFALAFILWSALDHGSLLALRRSSQSWLEARLMTWLQWLLQPPRAEAASPVDSAPDE